MLRVRIPPGPFSKTEHRSARHRQWSRFKSQAAATTGTLRRQSGSPTLVICGFDSHSCQWVVSGWCSSRRSVKPLPSNCEAVGERFNSFTTQSSRWPRRLPVQDTALSRRKRGFDSRRGYSERISLYLSFPGAAGVRPGSHKAGSPGSIPGPGTCGRAGARPSFICSDAAVRLPGPQRKC